MQNGGLRSSGITKKSTDEKPLISVVTVVYNGEATLEQTILSVVSQTYENVEYIIVDGGSKDGTIDIIKKYECKIDYWQSEPDRGIYDAMNKGIGLALGEWIYIIGADDFFVDENVINELSDLFIGSYDVISGTVWAVNSKGFQYAFDNNYSRTIDEDNMYGISAPHQGIFIRRKIMNKYLFDIKYNIAADLKLNLQLWGDRALKIKKVKNKIAYYSCEGTSGKNIKKRTQETKEILKEFNCENLAHVYLSKDKSFIMKIKKLFSNNTIIMCLKVFFHKMYKHKCRWEKCPYCQH